MILIFGGAYQGKLKYAQERFGAAEDDIFYCAEEDTAPPIGAKIICGLEKWLLALVKSDIDIENVIRRLIADCGGAVVICCDITCGVVPVDPVMRRWREAVGRALSMLSNASDEVIRMFCGIPARLKG